MLFGIFSPLEGPMAHCAPLKVETFFQLFFGLEWLRKNRNSTKRPFEAFGEKFSFKSVNVEKLSP